MKVVISVLGRFHAFDLARELFEESVLEKLITSYPAFVTRRFGIPSHKTHSIFGVEFYRRAWSKLPQPIKCHWNSQYFFNHLFDLRAAQRIPKDADIFVGWAGSSLNALRHAKQMGLVTVLERGSAHIRVQEELLTEEYERLGYQFTETHPKIVEQELIEYAQSDYISVPSTFVANTFLAQRFSQDKLISVPYGYSARTFYPIDNKEPHPFRVIFCGGISLRKGVHYLIEAFSQLKLPNAELWLVGSMSDEIRTLLTRLPSTNIHALGVKSPGQLCQLFNQSSVFCLPSIEDGFGLVILQAMGTGLPVICSEHTGGPDVIEEGKSGFVVAPRNIDNLKEKILWCYEHQSQCRQMGEYARKTVFENFQWHHYGKKMANAYHKILVLK